MSRRRKPKHSKRTVRRGEAARAESVPAPTQAFAEPTAAPVMTGAASTSTALPVVGTPWVIFAAVFVLGLAVRLVVAAELGSTALFRWPELDAAEFLGWARRLASGSLALPYYPTHGLPYPYFLALLWKLGGGSLDVVREVQSGLGATTCVLIAATAGSIWRNRWAALTAGGLAALYGPLVLVDVSLWEEGLLMFFLALFLLCLTGTHEPRAWKAGLGGLALGGSIAVRPTMILLVALGALVMLAPDWRSRARRRSALWLVAASALVVVPVVVAVSRSAGTFIFERGYGAVNVWIGNDPAGGGIQNARIGGPWDRLEAEPARAGLDSPKGVEGIYLRKTIERAIRHPSGQIGVLASKLVWLVQAEEPRDNHSFYFFQRQSRLLAALPGFGCTFALAVVGVGFEWRQRRRWLWIAGYLLATAMPVLAALAGLRYRLPMVLGWLLLAAAGGAVVERAIVEKRWRKLGAMAVVVVVAWSATHLRRHVPSHSFGEEWALSGSSELELGELDAAERDFRRADEEAPALGLGVDGLGRVRRRQGRNEEAERFFRQAIERDPDAMAPHLHLADLLQARGESAAALAEVERVLTINPLYQPALERAAEVAGSQRDLDEARGYWKRLAKLGRGNAMAWRRVGQIDGALGDPKSGLLAARAAIELEPRRSDGWELLGFLAVEADDTATAGEALSGLRRVDPGATARAPVRLLEAAVDYMKGDYPSADGKLRVILRGAPTLAQARGLLLRNAIAWGRRDDAEAFLQELPTSAPAAVQPPPS